VSSCEPLRPSCKSTATKLRGNCVKL
jgi:hypothetical protein